MGSSLAALGRFKESLPPLERALTIGPIPKAQRADADAALGRTLCETRGDAQRVRSLTDEAVATYRALGGARVAAATSLPVGCARAPGAGTGAGGVAVGR